MIRFILAFFLSVVFFAGFSKAEGGGVFVLSLKDEVNPSTARYIIRGIHEAEAKKADLILLHMDTYGGLVVSADSIRTALLDTEIPTAVLIDRNAGSAGALIALACDSIYMSEGASMGAATVVDGETGLAMPDKYQSYFRGLMRATAEQNHRNPQIAEKMVDEKLDLPGISPKGQVITLTTQEAIKYGFCDGVYETPEEIAWSKGLSPGTLHRYQPNLWEDLAKTLTSPWISALLVVLIFGGMVMELKAPGSALPGLVSVLAIAAFFIPHYSLGMAAPWEIVTFVIGIAFLILEIFVLPGFGVAGILGFLLIGMGLMASSLSNEDYTFWNIPVSDILRSTAFTLVLMATAILLAIWMARHLLTSQRAAPFVDGNTQAKEKGYTAGRPELEALVGLEGIAVSPMMPGGFVEIQGKRYDSEAKKGYIDRGTPIRVLSVRSLTLIVEKA